MTIQALIEKYQGKSCKSIRRIGGGYYADVYRVTYGNGESIVVKVYKVRGIMENEKCSDELLSEYALAAVPEVLWVHKADGEFSKDVMAMSFLEGTIGGAVYYLSNAKRKRLADSVAENLLAFHRVHSSDGFGELDSDIRYETFNEYYRKKAESVLTMADALERKGELTSFVTDTLKSAYAQFDCIFRLPITDARLVHGDYNMWNILVDRKSCSVSAVIDPCGCMWADSEYDLYQLNNANGKRLGIFEAYAAKRELSENCLEKMAFYELFNSVEHYYTSGHRVRKRKMDKRTKQLRKFLEV